MVAIVKPRPAELLERMGDARLYHEARERKMSLSRLLDLEQPPDEYNDGLDGFQRVLRAAGIVMQSSADEGYVADTFAKWDDHPTARGLIPEWMHRIWRRTASGKANDMQTRAVYTSLDTGQGTVLQPISFATDPRYQQIAPAIPLSELVARITPIDGGTYEAFYLVNDAPSQRMARVAQGTEIPRVKIVGGDHIFRLKKYGRVIEATYEMLRRQRIDMVQLHIQRIAVQAETDKVAAALDIMVNGDGNSGTAATNYNLTSLDAAAVSGTLTLKAWIAFRTKFQNPYAMTHALAQDAMAQQLLLLNIGSANIPLVALPPMGGFGQFTPINPQLADGVRLGLTSDAPANKIVGFDHRFALELVTEIGADIQEIERFVTRQVQAVVLSENNTFAVLDGQAVRVLTVNA